MILLCGDVYIIRLVIPGVDGFLILRLEYGLL